MSAQEAAPHGRGLWACPPPVASGALTSSRPYPGHPEREVSPLAGRQKAPRVARPPGSRRAGAAGRFSGVAGQLTIALLSLGYALGAALGWGSEGLALFMGDFGLSAAAAFAGLSCLRYAVRRSDPQFRPAWLLFGVSSLMAGAGNAVWGWYELVVQQPMPRPSAADFCFLLFAPPAIVGLLVLAKRPRTRARWVCLGLDAWLIGGSLLTLSWSLALAHTAYGGGDPVALSALNLAYPLLDIVLVSMVLVLHFRRTAAQRSAINTAIGALALTVLCDALFTSPILRDHYASGQLLDAGWFAGSLLLAYAPWVRRGEERTSAQEHAPAGTEQAAGEPARTGRTLTGSLAGLTPYLAAAVCVLGILYNSLDGREVDRVVLFTGCAVVLALLVRQGIMLVDNLRLTQELAFQECHFRSLVQGSSDVIMIAAADGVLQYVSPAALGVYGRDGDALVGCELATLVHPEDLDGVLHEIRRFLAASPAEEPSARIEYRFRHGDGHWLNVESTINRHRGGLIFNSRDVTERVRLQAQLQHNASHDTLTDLPNRALFTERVRKALGGRREGDGGAAVLYIDLDGFKAVNDTIGHQAGDELLVLAARRLRESIRSGDTAARLGGDEFAVLIQGDGDCGRHPTADRELRIHEIADRLRLTLSEPYQVEGENTVRVAASIGVAFAEPGITPSALMRNADLAMYRAKQAGKDRVELYAPQLQAEVVKRAELAARVRTALHDGEFALLHEPVVDLHTHRVTAVAAQARWRSAEGILFTPAEFLRAEGVPEADARGAHSERAAEVSCWLLREAVRQAASRRRAGFTAPVLVRLPMRRVTESALAPAAVEALLERHGLPAGLLVLELCESEPRVPLDELERRLGGLRRLGVRIVLEGFGSGYEALTALRRLPADMVRLDADAVRGVLESQRHGAVAARLLAVAGELGLQTLADGVDLPEQCDRLRELGCTHGQGAALGAPLDEHRLRGELARSEYVPQQRSLDPVGAVSGVSVARGAGGGAPSAVSLAPERLGTASLAATDALPTRGLELTTEGLDAGCAVVVADAPLARRGSSGAEPHTPHPVLRPDTETSVPPA